MDSPSKTLLALALSLAAVSASAQNTAVQVAPEGGMPASGVPGGAAAGSGAPVSAMPGASATIGGSPALGTAVAAPVANNSANPSAGAAMTPAAAAALASPSAATGRSASAAAAPSAAITAPSPADVSGSAVHSPVAAVHARPAASVAPAGAGLNGTVKRISEARLSENAGGDGASVSLALDRAFDAALGRPQLGGTAPHGVSARAQDARGAIAQKVGIANSASPADAPGLYQDAIQNAKDALPAPAAEGVAKVVRSFAARKADVSLGDLAAAAFKAAAGGSTSETGRLLGAFDKWESLLGVPGRPLISNAAALKGGVNELLNSATAGGAHSAPHVWFAKKDGSYTAMLPGASVAPVPALAAAFAIAPSALAPETALSDAYRAFSSDPRASTGAGLVYRARRTLGATVPGALLAASRFWLRAALESLWRRIVAIFKGSASYELSRKSGQDELRRDAALAETARGEAAAARRMLAKTRLTVADTRAAFAALARSAGAYRALTGEDAALASVSALSRSFESAAAWRRLGESDEVPPGLAELVSGPGALDFWAQRIEDSASFAVNGRFWRSRGAAEFVNLGADNGPAAFAAAAAKAAAGSPLSIVTLDDRFWARGKGANGEARLSAELRATATGGGVQLFVERGDAALSRRLEDMGLTVFPEGAGLRAVAGPEDFSYDAASIGGLASRALAAALGRDPAAGAGDALRELAAETRRDPSSAAALAALLDGREAFARAPVIGMIGDYEALAPMSVSVDGKPLLVSALRDPDTGLLAYARAARPDGVPLGAAELRALLRAK